MKTVIMLLTTIYLWSACSNEDKFDNGLQSANSNPSNSPSPSGSPSPTPTPSPSPSPSPTPNPNMTGEEFFLSNIKGKYTEWNCSGCHREGGAAPSTVLSYDTAKALLVQDQALDKKENKFYKTVRKQVGNHPADYCASGGDSNAICTALQAWWKKEVTPESFFTKAVSTKMQSPGMCLMCHSAASGTNSLADFAQVKARLDMDRVSSSNNKLINYAANANGAVHPGAGTYKCNSLTDSPCKEFMSWYELIYP